VRAFLDDARTGLRGLASVPWTHAVACLVLALGIGTFAAFLPHARAVLWPPIDPRVVVVGRPLGGGPALIASLEDLEVWRAAPCFAEVDPAGLRPPDSPARPPRILHNLARF